MLRKTAARHALIDEFSGASMRPQRNAAENRVANGIPPRSIRKLQ